MSGISAVNKAAAASIAGGDEAVASLIATGLGLIHVLQVYTSAMVRSNAILTVIVNLNLLIRTDDSRCMGLASMPSKYELRSL